jgi:hypothetical protein
MQTRTVAAVLVTALIAMLLPSCADAPSAKPVASVEAGKHSAIAISFDDSAADLMLTTLHKSTLTPGDTETLLANRGIDAIVRKSMVWVPEVKREDFAPYLRSVLAGKAEQHVFNLDGIGAQEAEIRSLMKALKEQEAPMRSRMIARLERYSPLKAPANIEVFYVAGGSSDGFVLDDDPRLAFFVAIDKASGDADGVEQNMTHELYHVMQKASAQRVPQAAAYAGSIGTKPPVEQLLMTTLLEGTANFVADARETAGSGPYVSMWRGRYLRNATPERMNENFRSFERALTGLDAGKTSWQEVYDAGFSGGADSRFYFVGMEMARALAAARGPEYFVDLFTRPPAQFFRDYLALPGVRGSHTDLSAEARAVIERQMAGW